MREYDRGFVNPTMADGLWRLVPRAIWPDKPTAVGPGRWFYQYVTGSDRQAPVGITMYADAYWNGGWIAVVREHGYAVVALRGRHSKAEDDYSPDVSQRESHLFAVVSPPRVFEISKFSNFSIEKSVDTKSGFHDETFFDGEKSEL